MKKTVIFLASLVLFACNNNGNNKQEAASSLDRQLLGEWNNLSIHVDIQSKNNTDSNEVFSVDRPEWEQKLRIKPIRTFFREDSTWNSAHYTLNDSLEYNPSGKWWMEGTTLVMLQQLPSPDTTSYTLKIQADTATFEGLLDWDMDGKKDDRYLGRQVRQSTVGSSQSTVP